MTTTVHDITYRLEQKRRVQADFPGPKSVALTERRKAVVASGVASSVPVYVADADGGIIHDVDGNSFIDLGSGIAVTSVGASDPPSSAPSRKPWSTSPTPASWSRPTRATWPSPSN